MPNFVDDMLTLAFPKKTLVSVPVGDEDKYLRSGDWNAVCQALYDIRAKVIALVAGAVAFADVAKTSIRSDRASNQSPTDAAKVGITNFGSDTTGVTTGASADYATIGGGNRNVASGDYSCVPGGSRNVASNFCSVAMGFLSTASGDTSFAACSSLASGAYAAAIGDECTASGTGAVALGRTCTAGGTRAVAIGESCTASVANAIAMGRLASCAGTDGVAIGKSAFANAQYALALGESASATAVNAVAIMGTSQSTKAMACIGGQVQANSPYAVSLGLQSQATRPTQHSFSAGAYAVNGSGGTRGSAQTSFLLMQATTLNTEAGETVELMARDANLNLAGCFALENFRAYAIVITVIAAGTIDPGGANTRVTRSFRRLYSAGRLGSAGTETLTTGTSESSGDAAASSWTLEASVAPSPDRIKILFSLGSTRGAVSVFARVDFQEVSW